MNYDEAAYAEDVAAEQEYKCRIKYVLCDICSSEASGTAEELKRRGWTIGGGNEICGGHD